MKILLCDADGVMTLPEEFFSVMYARSHGISDDTLESFFRSDWNDIVSGKKDLKEAISERSDVWQWHKDPQELLDMWFKAEDIRNDDMIAVVQDLREQGVPCYLATNQEQYRGAYMKNIMFPGLFDGYFISAEMGVKKPDTEYYEHVMREFEKLYPEIKPQDIIFVDDDRSNVEAAQKVGMQAIFYENPEHVRSQF